MRYIIENANVVSDKGIVKRSYLITENKINYYSTSLSRYKGMRMNVSSFFMTSGRVNIDYDILNITESSQYRGHLKNLVKKGCTTVLAPFHLKYEQEFKRQLDVVKHKMINSTIDFVIGLYVPLEKITPTIIRLCRKYKVPFIVVDVTENSNLYSVPWGWIKEAMFQYSVPIYPLWKIEHKKILKEQKFLWEDITAVNGIPTYLEFPTESSPLQKPILKQIGLYPKKGELLIGNELDYNLYLLSADNSKVEVTNELDYDKYEPIIAVHKGRILKAVDTVNYYPGFGEHLEIKIPGLFASLD